MTQNHNYSVGGLSVGQVDVLAICRNVFVLEYVNFNNCRVRKTRHEMIKNICLITLFHKI